MAKGLRASSRKKNNAALRERVFGPAFDARTARLSAKLQEIAAQPPPEQERAMNMDEDVEKEDAEKSTEADDAGRLLTRGPKLDADVLTAMDIDAELSTKNSKKKPSRSRSGRIEKKVPRKKPRNSIVFADYRAQRRRQKEQALKQRRNR